MDFDYMLTTVDNPFDPFDDFKSWYLFDIEKGYKTCETLDRIVKLSDGMSELEKDKAYNLAIDQIIEFDFLNIYKRVQRKAEDIYTDDGN